MKPLLLIFSLLMITGVVFGQDDYVAEQKRKYEENILKEEINGVYIPINIDDAMMQLDEIANEESRAKLIGADEELVVERLNRGLGKWMISKWNFYEGSRLSHHLKQLGVSLPNDMSSFLIRTYYRQLNELPLQIEERAAAIYDLRKKEQEERNKLKKVRTIPN
jgi:hypothetical protein